jgi:hypothetical protein
MKLHKIAATIFAAGALAAAGASAQGGGAGSGASATPPGPVDSATGTSSAPSDSKTSTDSSTTKSKRAKKAAKAQGRSTDTNTRSSTYGDVVPGKATTDAHGVPVHQNNPIDDQAKAGKLAGPMTDSSGREAGSEPGKDK